MTHIGKMRPLSEILHSNSLVDPNYAHEHDEELPDGGHSNSFVLAEPLSNLPGIKAVMKKRLKLMIQNDSLEKTRKVAQFEDFIPNPLEQYSQYSPHVGENPNSFPLDPRPTTSNLVSTTPHVDINRHNTLGHLDKSTRNIRGDYLDEYTKQKCEEISRKCEQRQLEKSKNHEAFIHILDDVYGRHHGGCERGYGGGASRQRWKAAHLQRVKMTPYIRQQSLIKELEAENVRLREQIQQENRQGTPNYNDLHTSGSRNNSQILSFL